MTFAMRNKRLANVNVRHNDTPAFFVEVAGGASSYGHFSCASAFYGFTTRCVFFYNCWTIFPNFLADLVSDHGRLKRPCLYLTVATKSSNFFVTFMFPTYPVHK